MNSEGLPRAGTRAKASASGEWLMSPPRMLNSQAMESSSVKQDRVGLLAPQGLLQLGDLLLGAPPGELGTMRDDRR